MNKNFKDLGISDILISALEKQSVNEPTEVPNKYNPRNS